MRTTLMTVAISLATLSNTKEAHSVTQTQSSNQAASQPTAQAQAPSHDGARDFDFLMGRWRIHNRRLRERLKGSTDWVEFEATSVERPILSGAGNEEEYRTEFWKGFVGMAFRFFDPATRKWSIFWADSHRGALEPPVVGSFTGDSGVFEGSDTFEGRPIRIRFIWSRVTTKTPRWEQAFSADDGKTWETNWTMDFSHDEAPRTKDFQVIELRRYAIKPGERKRFAKYFEAYFPEAFQQLGAIALGEFLERKNSDWFTWMRGFKDIDARAAVNAAFYDGPLWREHAKRMNDLLDDSDNVLLLRPLDPTHAVELYPAVDAVDAVVAEKDSSEKNAARGIVVAQIFAVKPNEVEAFAKQAEATFAAYRAAGAQEAGILVTLDVPNNFPRLPIRTDGPFLVWLGVVRDEGTLNTQLLPTLEASRSALSASGHLRGEPELVILDPTPRSRLRHVTAPKSK